MTPGEASLVLFGIFFALMFLRVPIAFALGLACVPLLLFEERLSPMILFNETFKAYNSFILLAGNGFGAFSTCTRHMRQLAAIDSFLW